MSARIELQHRFDACPIVPLLEEGRLRCA